MPRPKQTPNTSINSHFSIFSFAQANTCYILHTIGAKMNSRAQQTNNKTYSRLRRTKFPFAAKIYRLKNVLPTICAILKMKILDSDGPQTYAHILSHLSFPCSNCWADLKTKQLWRPSSALLSYKYLLQYLRLAFWQTELIECVEDDIAHFSYNANNSTFQELYALQAKRERKQKTNSKIKQWKLKLISMYASSVTLHICRRRKDGKNMHAWIVIIYFHGRFCVDKEVSSRNNVILIYSNGGNQNRKKTIICITFDKIINIQTKCTHVIDAARRRAAHCTDKFSTTQNMYIIIHFVHILMWI